MTHEGGDGSQSAVELMQKEIALHEAVWKRFMDDIDATRDPGEPIVFEDVPSVQDGATNEERDEFAKQFAEGSKMPEGLPPAEGIHTWQGLIYYCMRELGYPVKLLSREWHVRHKDGGIRAVRVIHGFDAEVEPEALDVARRCFATDTAELDALKLAMDPPKDSLASVKDIVHDVAEGQGPFAESRFIGRAIVNALLEEGKIRFGLAGFHPDMEQQKLRLAHYYETFRAINLRPLGPEEMCGLAMAHIKQAAAGTSQST
jgi:hypothetical protein